MGNCLERIVKKYSLINSAIKYKNTQYKEKNKTGQYKSLLVFELFMTERSRETIP